ncbi:MAG: AAA family ATPase [Pseudomonadota bacterium]
MNDNANPTDLSDELLDQLGLSEQPFIDHAGDGYLYSDSKLDMTSNIIMEYLTNPATTIVLTGERGVGKTTFLRKVLRLGYQQYQFCTVRVRENTKFEFIEEKIKQRWELSSANVKSPVIDLSIENYVISYLREHPHAVLIIDDAHNLDSSTLDRLLTLKHRIGLACSSGMGFIMAGEPPLKVKITELEESNPACTQTYQIDVRPLNREQTESYLMHRLNTAGLISENPLNDSDISQIYDSSSGNFRKIHLEAARLLQGQMNQSIHHDSTSAFSEEKKPNSWVMLIVALFIIAIILLVALKQCQSDSPDQKEIIIPQKNPSALTTSDEDVTEIELEAPENNDDSITINQVSEDTSVARNEAEQPNENGSAEKDSLLAESIEQIEETEENKDDPSIEEQVSPSVPPAPAPTHGESWLKNLDPSHFTLQVVASKEPEKLEQLIKSEKLSSEYAYFQKPVNGSTYYVLVVGDFESRQDAIKASEQLSQSLRKNKPWPIPVSKIHPYLK